MKHTSVHGPVSHLGAADPRRQRSNGYRAARYEDAPISKLEAVRPQVVVFRLPRSRRCVRSPWSAPESQPFDGVGDVRANEPAVPTELDAR